VRKPLIGRPGIICYIKVLFKKFLEMMWIHADFHLFYTYNFLTIGQSIKQIAGRYRKNGIDPA
jgi:hypothetical protein